jgi:single-stranded DNA-binding protein
MDLNLAVLCGRLATDAEVRVFDSGTRLIRYLVILRVDYPRKRTDVIPVTLWEPEDELAGAPGDKGDRIWVCGSVQRRYWEGADGRRSRVEVIAEQVTLRVDDLEPVSAK